MIKDQWTVGGDSHFKRMEMINWCESVSIYLVHIRIVCKLIAFRYQKNESDKINNEIFDFDRELKIESKGSPL